jgi:hypothetical protein
MSFPYWQYYLAIELSLEETTRFVEATPDNYKTYSIEYARLLLSASSEIDVVCKLLCQKIDSTANPQNINEYRHIITNKYPNFYKMKVVIPRYGIEFFPWLKWQRSTNPDWWKSYNNVKHERSNHFAEANLENTFNAVAGLFSLLLYYYKPELFSLKLPLSDKLFTIEDVPATLVDGHFSLPDFQDDDD